LSTLVNKFLKAGFIHFEGFTDSKLVNKIGTPQGSILSPLFCNILLHEFDIEIKNMTKDINNIRNEKVSAEYKKAISQYVGTE
jgi:retron-type reverse transcriptase